MIKAPSSDRVEYQLVHVRGNALHNLGGGPASSAVCALTRLLWISYFGLGLLFVGGHKGNTARKHGNPCCGKSVILIGCSLCIYKKWGYSGYTGTTPQTRAIIGFSFVPTPGKRGGTGGDKASSCVGKASVVPTVPNLEPTKYLMKWVQLNP